MVKVARPQDGKQLEVISPVAITRLVIVPMLVNGRYELHFPGLPEGTEITRGPVTAPVTSTVPSLDATPAVGIDSEGGPRNAA